MRRQCDGTDPNLIAYVNPANGEKLSAREKLPAIAKESPCDCGLVFDDVRRLTIWPHERV